MIESPGTTVASKDAVDPVKSMFLSKTIALHDGNFRKSEEHFSVTHTHTPHHDSLTDCLPLVLRGLPAMCVAAAAGQRRPAAVGLPPLAPGRLALAGDVLPPAPAPCLMCYRFKIHSLLTRSVCPTSPSHNQRAQCYWTP